MSDTNIRTLEREALATGENHLLERLARLLKRSGQEPSYNVKLALERLDEERARENPIGKVARVWSVAGPCFTSGVRKSGLILRETNCYYVTTGGKIRKDKAHLAPCTCCTDHPETYYPMGCMD